MVHCYLNSSLEYVPDICAGQPKTPEKVVLFQLLAKTLESPALSSRRKNYWKELLVMISNQKFLQEVVRVCDAFLLTYTI